MLNCEEIWCRGILNPALALTWPLCKRVLYRMVMSSSSTERVWMSYAHDAAYCFLLARTDPDVPKHKGLSCFIVDMKSQALRCAP